MPEVSRQRGVTELMSDDLPFELFKCKASLLFSLIIRNFISLVFWSVG